MLSEATVSPSICDKDTQAAWVAWVMTLKLSLFLPLFWYGLRSWPALPVYYTSGAALRNSHKEVDQAPKAPNHMAGEMRRARHSFKR